ncbi:hypothetical protein K6Q96_17180 [Grimontia kaedaensis]|uniref:Lipoprotein n=1 Tax=Grimontia kaedaensis TaxID=2872157 RepID=A0ABY4X148_9GAMM|nr:hypothetical protein [Grimontia kaedaensis]USH04967.1 hypothetical protein K6Q96_17180 [Grimontia kaedaensis]
MKKVKCLAVTISSFLLTACIVNSSDQREADLNSALRQGGYYYSHFGIDSEQTREKVIFEDKQARIASVSRVTMVSSHDGSVTKALKHGGKGNYQIDCQVGAHFCFLVIGALINGQKINHKYHVNKSGLLVRENGISKRFIHEDSESIEQF